MAELFSVGLALAFAASDVGAQGLGDDDDDVTSCDIYGNCTTVSGGQWLLWTLVSTGLFLAFCVVCCWWCCRRVRACSVTRHSPIR
jgi:hypothetical protein